MKRITTLVMTLTFLPLTLSPLSQAHHSSAPHFDSSKKVSLTGLVTKYEQRNPHAYLHITVEDADGRSKSWRCESHGATMLSRNGITPDILKPGTYLTIEGIPHRRDPQGCFFNTVYLQDGRSLSVNGPRNQATPEVEQRDSIFGTWMLTFNRGARPSTSGPQDMMNFLTPAGEAAAAAYNPFVDDPTYRCEPVTPRRAWYAPGTPMAIKREGDNIIIQHEWMDVKRLIHMNLTEIPANTPRSIMGFSIGRFEGDTLVIETAHFSPGVLRQYVEEEGKPTRGMLHSEALRLVETVSFDQASNRIKLTLESYDPKFFSKDFEPAHAEFAASDLNIEPFGCIPEILK